MFLLQIDSRSLLLYVCCFVPSAGTRQEWALYLIWPELFWQLARNNYIIFSNYFSYQYLFLVYISQINYSGMQWWDHCWYSVLPMACSGQTIVDILSSQWHVVDVVDVEDTPTACTGQTWRIFCPLQWHTVSRQGSDEPVRSTVVKPNWHSIYLTSLSSPYSWSSVDVEFCRRVLWMWSSVDVELCVRGVLWACYVDVEFCGRVLCGCGVLWTWSYLDELCGRGVLSTWN